MKALGNLLGSEGINAATVLALSGTLVALVAKGDGPPSLKRVVLQTLSNPVPRLELVNARDTGEALRAAPPLRTAA
jgi:hypothetical protein